MKIVSIYIEKFGGLQNKRIEFKEGLNIIFAENEYGKSTIAEFIKLMLYGQTKTAQSIRENERKRFIPWGEKTMGGEMTVSNDSGEYIIRRSFGKRKGDDTVTVIDSVTGSQIPSLCTQSPGDILLNIGKEGFEKSLYIGQLATKIEADKDDEILKKLINLAQSGDDSVSYQRAIQILDASVKELNGTRPKGKIPEIQEEISKLYSIKASVSAENNQSKIYAEQLTNLQAQKKELESIKIDTNILQKCRDLYSKYQSESENILRLADVKRKNSLLQIAIAVILTAILSIIKWYTAIPTTIWAIIIIVKYLKSKKDNNPNNQYLEELFTILNVKNEEKLQDAISALEQDIAGKEKANTVKLMSISEQIGDLQNKLKNSNIKSASSIDEEIFFYNNQISEYNKIIEDINTAKSAINKAFGELQKNFGQRLNGETSKILKQITGGKYSEVLIDNEYNMQVRISETNELQDAQFLSSGTFDQIYFALRMGIVNIIFENAIIILDDAFVQYDDTRLALALDYIKSVSEKHQIIMFSCHKREGEYLNAN